MQAKAATKARDPFFVDNLIRRMARLGYGHSDANSPIDVVQLTAAMRASGAAIEDRMALRSNLWQLRMIPA
jgi:hypothetical protein